MRIVSLLPSTTEIVCDLGLEVELVGVTAECNWPNRVQDGREIVVRSFADAAMTPGEIDEFVRQRLDAGLDLYAYAVDQFEYFRVAQLILAKLINRRLPLKSRDFIFL